MISLNLFYSGFDKTHIPCGTLVQCHKLLYSNAFSLYTIYIINEFFYKNRWYLFCIPKQYYRCKNVLINIQVHCCFCFECTCTLRNWIFATNLDFPISLKLDGVNLDHTIHGLKYLKSTTLGCKDIGKRKSEFVTKIQFVSLEI